MPRREKEPFIHEGDRILIEQGAPGGIWDVRAARWARADDENDDRIELVLSRSSLSYKTVFNEKTMRHQSNWPQHILSRDITVGKPIQFKPKQG
ncbi:MAG: hypothetical protein ACAH83_19525 [Alphaproteobacteria bacterium]